MGMEGREKVEQEVWKEEKKDVRSGEGIRWYTQMSGSLVFAHLVH